MKEKTDMTIDEILSYLYEVDNSLPYFPGDASNSLWVLIDKLTEEQTGVKIKKCVF